MVVPTPWPVRVMPSLTLNQRLALSAHASARAAKRMSAQRQDREAKTIGLLLGAHRFHPRAIHALAHRRHFARAARLLERAIGASLTEALQSPLTDRVRIF